MRWVTAFVLGIGMVFGLRADAERAALAQPTEKPFGLPFDTDPGPSTWLLGQLYGNTTGAYRTRVVWYGAGQGLHFGLDFPARCGTTVVAIGDGEVIGVDDLSHGAGPHNLIIRHNDDYLSLYGHLLETPSLQRGQAVTRGEAIGLTGDPDVTCASRPHLHLEIRSSNYAIAYNPVNLIDTDWSALMLAGSFGRGFARDLSDPRRWQYAEDQPDVRFGGALLNDYANPWPLDWRP
jgi:murein DD-endopeptidase MepM/ murein hydrolase activator NlpD